MELRYNLFTLKRELEIATGRSYSWAEIARAVDVHPNTLYNITHNRTRGLDLDTLGRVILYFNAQGLKVGVGDFLTWEAQPPDRHESATADSA